jgi:hypothetical protein
LTLATQTAERTAAARKVRIDILLRLKAEESLALGY